MALETYFDCAEDEYRYFKFSYDHQNYANAMGSEVQSICERYLKDLISKYDNPQTKNDSNQKESILHTHNLTRLISYLKENVDIEFSSECESEMRIIDGYYFSTRYPGDDSIELTKTDIAHCNKALDLCRQEVISIERERDIIDRSDDLER